MKSWSGYMIRVTKAGNRMGSSGIILSLCFIRHVRNLADCGWNRLPTFVRDISMVPDIDASQLKLTVNADNGTQQTKATVLIKRRNGLLPGKMSP